MLVWKDHRMWSNVSFLMVRSVLGVLRLGPTADANHAEIEAAGLTR